MICDRGVPAVLQYSTTAEAAIGSYHPTIRSVPARSCQSDNPTQKIAHILKRKTFEVKWETIKSIKSEYFNKSKPY